MIYTDLYILSSKYMVCLSMHSGIILINTGLIKMLFMTTNQI